MMKKIVVTILCFNLFFPLSVYADSCDAVSDQKIKRQVEEYFSAQENTVSKDISLEEAVELVRTFSKNEGCSPHWLNGHTDKDTVGILGMAGFLVGFFTALPHTAHAFWQNPVWQKLFAPVLMFTGMALMIGSFVD